MSIDAISYLSQFLGERRLNILRSALDYRTRYLTVCLEDIYQSQNASAVLRTCDAFGIQDVHVVEDRHTHKINPLVTRGASKWIDIHKYGGSPAPTLDAVAALKADGYRIVATSPHANDVSLEDFDIAKGKVALFFGTELSGVSDTLKNSADEYLRIPMYGFVESFNISVSAAVILHHLSLKLRSSSICWQLSDQEKQGLLLAWMKKSIREADKIMKCYHEFT